MLCYEVIALSKFEANDFVELFAGKAAVTRALRAVWCFESVNLLKITAHRYGFRLVEAMKKGAAMDKEYSSNLMDMLSPSGFLFRPYFGIDCTS